MLSKALAPASITPEQFNRLLDKYPALVESISKDKSSKPGQKTLAQLDDFRYKEAIELFSSTTPKRPMNHDDVKALVDWKLRHGKFRPTLMKLVSSNSEETVQNTISTAVRTYRSSVKNKESDGGVAAAAALDAIAKALKGVGPATASLLLSVHDPDRVIFFSDEAFWWLCCGGLTGSPIKYNAKEYRELSAVASRLVERLGVGATDIERVAYVVMKQGDDVGGGGSPDLIESSPATAKKMKGTKESEKGAAKKLKTEENELTGTKRKEAEGNGQGDLPVRRSKRGKPT
ncbi:hypothetical protein BX600DRAFT_35959 [Xylariales sp. PMI_506]|nr:hypothetical protein BX600DRAFT_35959 [Xylariales sp. PMI_506]